MKRVDMRLASSIRLAVGAMAMLAFTATARADIVQRETDITNLRLGQRVYVDDGSCPAGQIKEIAGMRLTSNGVERAIKCVDRKGKR